MYKGHGNVRVMTVTVNVLSNIDDVINGDVNVLDIINISHDIDGYRVTFIYETF